MNYNQAVEIVQNDLLSTISTLYNLDGYKIKPIEAHYGGRNIIYLCESVETISKILRISYLDDRAQEDFLAELEYVRYLCEKGASVSNVIDSKNGNFLEEIKHNNHKFYVCLFEKAKGKMLVQNNYRYREGVSLNEYFFNCGKVLGKMHQLSKKYEPFHHRNTFFDKFNMQYINQLIPDCLSLLRMKMEQLIYRLEDVDRNNDTFGMIHFDYNDGNYNIDFDNGQITVYDFDNSCFGWYMYDLAGLWTHGVGWIQFEKDINKRRKFMDDYFSTVISGYKSEVQIKDSMLDELPLFIQASIMENIVDEFEVARNNSEELDLSDEELCYLIKCLNEDIPYKGFFDEIYSCGAPFECKG